MTATTERCPGCHGSGIEMSGVTYAGMSEYVGCHECGPECPDDCGCRASDATERPESIAPRHPGATQSPDGSPSATEGLRGPESATGPDLLAVLGVQIEKARAARHATSSDVRSVSPARDAVSDAEAAQWAALADAATEGPWVVDSDGSIGAPMAGLVCGEAGHPRLDCSECGTRVCHVNVMPGEPDAAFIAAARTAVPRLLVEREALRAYAGPGPYEPSEADGATWQELRERDALRATVRLMLGDAAAEGRCGCVALCEGPQEDCPLHGRDYAWWVGLAGTACADREWLMAENARMRQVAELRVGTWRDTAARLEAERDRARGTAATLEAENAQLTADLAAMEAEDNREHVRARHWTEVLRVRRELDGIRREMNDVTEIIAEALGYRPSGLPLDGWPHLSTTGDHTPTSLAAEAAGVLAKASRLRAGIEALAAEMQSDTCPSCHVSYADEGSTTWGCDHTEGMQHAGDMLRALLAEGGE